LGPFRFLQHAAKLCKRCIYYGISTRLSVHLSITLQYCVKTREHRRTQYSPSGSPVSLVFWCQEWLMGDDPVRVKLECKESTPFENSRAVHSSVNANRTSTMGFPMSHQPRSCITPNFPKMRFRYPNLSCFAEILTKNHYKSDTKFQCLKTSSGKL